MMNRRGAPGVSEQEQMLDVWRSTLSAVEIAGSVNEWARKYRRLSAAASANEGAWSTEHTPYLDAMMDGMSVDDPCHTVVIQGSSQVGKTECVLNAIGYRIHQWPVPVLIVVPRDEDVKKYSELRIDPLVRDTPALRPLIGKTEYGRPGTDTMAVKRFPGGSLSIRASWSPGTYRSDPVGMIILDDLDAFSDNVEGDHAEQALRRTNTFSAKARKRIIISTPTEEGSSLVAREFEHSSQGRYWVPCPSCGSFQVLWFEAFRWFEDNPDTAHFVCQHCQAAIYERDKPGMLAAGHWQHARPERMTTTKGFHIWAAYAPSQFMTWAQLAESYMSAVRALKKSRDDSKLRVAKNLDWGVTFVPEGALRLSEQEKMLFGRREQAFQPAQLPIRVITAGVDVQADRLEVSCWGWGVGTEAWMLDHRIINAPQTQDGAWILLIDHLLDSGVTAACIDANAFTDNVLDMLTAFGAQLLRQKCAFWAIRGANGPGPLWPKMIMPGNQKDGRCRLVSIHPDAGKDWLFEALAITTPGPRYIHFDINAEQRYFRQLLAERRREKTDGAGRSKYVLAHGRERNEALDCAVYARAALHARAAIDLRVRSLFEATDESRPPTPQPANPPRRGKKRNGWIKRSVL